MLLSVIGTLAGETPDIILSALPSANGEKNSARNSDRFASGLGSGLDLVDIQPRAPDSLNDIAEAPGERLTYHAHVVHERLDRGNTRFIRHSIRET